MSDSQPPILLHAEETGLQVVYVYDHGGSRHMVFGALDGGPHLVQSEMPLDADAPMRSDYQQAMVALVATHPRVDSALLIGVGGGILAKAMHRVLPGCRIDAVDLDPAVIRIAQELFGLSDPQLTLHAMDGRAFVQQALADGNEYDAIVIDACDQDYIPERLMTVEFQNELKGILAPGGIIVINSFGLGALRDRCCATHAAAFGDFLELGIDTSRVVVAQPCGVPAAHGAREQSALLRIVGVDAQWVRERTRPPAPWNRNASPVSDSEIGCAELRCLREGARFNC